MFKDRTWLQLLFGVWVLEKAIWVMIPGMHIIVLCWKLPSEFVCFVLFCVKKKKRKEKKRESIETYCKSFWLDTFWFVFWSIISTILCLFLKFVWLLLKCFLYCLGKKNSAYKNCRWKLYYEQNQNMSFRGWTVFERHNYKCDLISPEDIR